MPASLLLTSLPAKVCPVVTYVNQNTGKKLDYVKETAKMSKHYRATTKAGKLHGRIFSKIEAEKWWKSSK